MFVSSLTKKCGNIFSGVGNPAAEILKFSPDKFVFTLTTDFVDPRLQCDQSAGDCVRNNIDRADPKLPSFAKITLLLELSEEPVHFIDQFGGCDDSLGIA